MYSAAMDAVFLSAALAEARLALEGARVVGVAADGSEGLVLETHGPAGLTYLSLGWEAWGPRWYLRPEAPEGGGEGPFVAAVARRLRGGRITALVRPGLERAVGIGVEWRRGHTVRRTALWSFLWPARRNAVLVDADTMTVIGAARPGPWRPGAPFTPPRAGQTFLDLESPEQFEAQLLRLFSGGCDTEAALARALPGLGPVLAREVAFRAAQRLAAARPPQSAVAGSPAGVDVRGLWAALEEVRQAVRQGRFAPRVILGSGGVPQALAAIALDHVPEERQRAYPAAGAAAEAFFTAGRAAAEEREARGGAARALRQDLERVVRRIRKLEMELAVHRQATAHRQMGEILVAHQREVPRGSTEARLPDPYGPPGMTRAIPIDPSLSVAGNAERYFKLARRGRRGEGLAARRLAAARQELDRLAELDKALADATTVGQVREVWAAARRLGHGGAPPAPPLPSLDPRLGRQGDRDERAGREAKVARRFISSHGLTILVGRSNAGNDELTLHIARPDDVWLHVQGYAGSHVVIRRQGRADVPRQTLVEAAQLAGYYSQARGQRKVPVHYTLRKHVRKPKGAKAGLVTITQEKTIHATGHAALVRRLAAAPHEAGA